MQIVFVPPSAPDEHASVRGREIEIPDCDCCRDMGQVMTPTTVWQGRTYIGHGPCCNCGTCASWPKKMRRWADLRAMNRPSLALPTEAIQAIEERRAQTYEELYPCPECLNGKAFRDWIDEPRDRKTGKKPFHPMGWERPDYDTASGQRAVEAYLLVHGPNRSRRVNAQTLDAMGRLLPKELRDATTLRRAAPDSEEYHEVKAELEERERQRQERAIGPEESEEPTE